MSNEIKIFESKEFGNVRVVMQENEPWFVAKDVCIPLEIGNVSQALSRLEADERNTIILNEGIGNPEKATINESGLYSLILTSRKPEAKKFKKWVTSEVLPAIRKTGGYMVDNGETVDELMARALKVADDTLRRRDERIKQAELEIKMKDQQITEFQPKVSYYDSVLQSKDLMTITQIAKDYGMGGRKMNELLRDLKIQYKQSNQWLLYQGYAKSGYTQSKTAKFHHRDGKEGTIMHTNWTQKGRLFLYELMKKNGILPIIERD